MIDSSARFLVGDIQGGLNIANFERRGSHKNVFPPSERFGGSRDPAAYPAGWGSLEYCGRKGRGMCVSVVAHPPLLGLTSPERVCVLYVMSCPEEGYPHTPFPIHSAPFS